MKKLVLALGLMATPLTAAEPCEPMLESFAAEIAELGYEMENYAMLDEVTVMLTFVSKDKSQREAIILTKHQGLENELSKGATVKAVGTCEYKRQTFNYIRVSTDSSVQAESLIRRTPGSKT